MSIKINLDNCEIPINFCDLSYNRNLRFYPPSTIQIAQELFIGAIYKEFFNELISNPYFIYFPNMVPGKCKYHYCLYHFNSYHFEKYGEKDIFDKYLNSLRLMPIHLYAFSKEIPKVALHINNQKLDFCCKYNSKNLGYLRKNSTKSTYINSRNTRKSRQKTMQRR